MVFFDRLTMAQCVNYNRNNRSVAAHHREKTGPILPLLVEWVLVQAGRQAQAGWGTKYGWILNFFIRHYSSRLLLCLILIQCKMQCHYNVINAIQSAFPK